MIIPVNEKFRIAADSRAWMIQEPKQRKHRRTGESILEWKSIRWYPTLESAVRGLAEHACRTSQAVGVAEAMAEIKNLAASLGTALAPHFDVIQRPDTASRGGSKK